MNEREKWLVDHGWMYGEAGNTLREAREDVPKDIHNAPPDPRDTRLARLEGLLREARGYVYGAACDVRERGEEMDIAYENPAADLHARIDAELEDDHEEL